MSSQRIPAEGTAYPATPGGTTERQATAPETPGTGVALDASTPYKDLDADLATRLAPTEQHPDDVIAHALAVLAGYGYGDEKTMAMIAGKLGLGGGSCRMVQQYVDAMLIWSTAHLVHLPDSKVAILCYRGTEPLNLINWVVDADPNQIPFYFLDNGKYQEHGKVHGGFHRNTRATRDRVLEILHSFDLEALYITGHSLGGAMAAMLVSNEGLGHLASKVRAVYTFGQPMIGDDAFAEHLRRQLADKGIPYLRYRHDNDVVPALPPKKFGEYRHAGQEYHLPEGRGPATLQEESTRRVGSFEAVAALWQSAWKHLFSDVPFAPALGNLLRQLVDGGFRPIEFWDHFPERYMIALRPKGVVNEYEGTPQSPTAGD